LTPATPAPRGELAETRETTRYLLLFGAILFVYLCTLSDANLGWVGDGQVMLDTAVSLHELGTLAIGYYDDPERGFIPRPGGFGKYGLGLSLVEQVPLLFADSIETSYGGGRSNLLFAFCNTLLTALVALAVALSVRALGRPFPAAALAACGLAFGTFAWPYISYDFSEPLQALCLTTSFWLLVRAVRAPGSSPAGLVLAGSALGFAVLTKANLLILIPGYALYLWYGLGSPFGQRLRQFGWFGISLGLWGLVIAVLNHYRFGSVIEFGYGSESAQFTTPLSQGLYGLLLSPNKGLLFYAPLALLAPGALWVSRGHRRELALLLTTSGLLVVLTSMWWSWEGGASWGPRLILPIVPLLTIGASLLLGPSRISSILFAICLGAGLVINLLGVLLNVFLWPIIVGLDDQRVPLDLSGRPAREYVDRDGQKWFSAAVGANYVPALSPILGHAWLLQLRYFGVPPPHAIDDHVKINAAHLTNETSLSLLRSAHLWLWDALSSRPREPLISDPIYGQSLQRLGDAAVNNGERDRAQQCYRHAAALMPNHTNLAIKLSRLQSARGALTEARETLMRYLAQHPRSQLPRLLLAQLYESAGDRSAAVREYRTYLSLGPDEESRREVERRIDWLAAGPP